MQEKKRSERRAAQMMSEHKEIRNGDQGTRENRCCREQSKKETPDRVERHQADYNTWYNLSNYVTEGCRDCLAFYFMSGWPSPCTSGVQQCQSILRWFQNTTGGMRVLAAQPVSPFSFSPFIFLSSSLYLLIYSLPLLPLLFASSALLGAVEAVMSVRTPPPRQRRRYSK